MEINAKTKLCGLLGNPVDHSLSPLIHNAAFQKLGLNFVYLAFKVEDLDGAIRGIRALGNLRGFSVTIPHKVAIIPFLDRAMRNAHLARDSAQRLVASVSRTVSLARIGLSAAPMGALSAFSNTKSAVFPV
jgi:hypothetical protein